LHPSSTRVAVHSLPTRRSSDLGRLRDGVTIDRAMVEMSGIAQRLASEYPQTNEGVAPVIQPFTDEYIGEEPSRLLYTMLGAVFRSEEHTSELQSRENLVCRLLL